MASLADLDTHVQTCVKLEKRIFLSVTFLIVEGGSENFNYAKCFFVSLHDHLYPEESNT